MKDDGGPAFSGTHLENVPIGGPGWSSETTVERKHLGMSLRDWFAGQALPGIVELFRINSAQEAASMAYKVADAMLEARKK